MKKAILFFLILPVRLLAQDSLLTLQNAIEISLKNNYDIRIAGNLSEQQENNNTIGNAGMLPGVDASGSYTRSTNSLKQTYNTGTEINRDAAVSKTTTADLA